VPASALAGLTPEQLEAVLAHELAHVRRHDYLVNLFQSLVETLLFYHPAVWWISKRIRVEREHCCDDLAVGLCGDPLTYVLALISLEELRVHAPAALALAATDGELLRRTRRLLRLPPPDREPRTLAWLATCTALVAVFFALVGAQDTDRPAVPGVTRPNVALPAEVELQVAVPADREVATRPEVAVPVQPSRPVSISSAPASRPVLVVEPVPAVAIGGRSQATAEADEAIIRRLEEEFRLAKVQADVAALDRLWDEAFVETNQNGNTRNKAQGLALWRAFRIDSLGLEIADVRVTNGVAIVSGSQTELNATGTDQMLFTRVWKKNADGRWVLVSASQFRDPRRPSPRRAVAPPPPPVNMPLQRTGGISVGTSPAATRTIRLGVVPPTPDAQEAQVVVREGAMMTMVIPSLGRFEFEPVFRPGDDATIVVTIWEAGPAGGRRPGEVELPADGALVQSSTVPSFGLRIVGPVQRR
jgi:ketosteroid isomerase-like protein